MGGLKEFFKKYSISLISVFIVLILGLLFYWINPFKNTEQVDFGADSSTYVTSDNSQTKNPKTLLSNDSKSVCLTTGGCPDTSSNIYLKFTVKNPRSYNAVKLVFYVTDVSQNGGVVKLTDDNWKESDVRWQNQPKEISDIIGSYGDTSRGGWFALSLPLKYFTESKTYSLKIQNNDKNTIGIVSTKNSRYKPYLSFYNVTNENNDKKSDNVVIAAGDLVCDYGYAIRGSNDDCKDKDTAQIVEKANPNFVLLAGDIQYENGEYKNFLNYFDKSWGKFKDKIKPSPGNHEYNNSIGQRSKGCTTLKENDPFSYACGYFDYFNGPNNLTGVAGKRGEGFYAFDIKNWRVYSMNSNCLFDVGCKAGGAQETWFRNDLAQNPNRCKLMFLHHPIAASDINNFDAYYEGLPDLTRYIQNKQNIENLRDIYKAFYDYGGDVVLAGHSHLYERFAKQNVNHQLDEKGFTEIVVGTGGRYTYGAAEKIIRPLSVTHSSADEMGVLKLNLEDTSFKWEFLGTPATNFKDSGEAKCNKP